MKTTLLPAILVILLVIPALQSFSTANSPVSADSFSLTEGKKLFAQHCTGCHGINGQGAYGPNLCDNYWIHGHHYHNIRHTIQHGTKAGMSSFKHILNHHQTRDVAHYVYLSLRNTNPTAAKAPEGKLHNH